MSRVGQQVRKTMGNAVATSLTTPWVACIKARAPVEELGKVLLNLNVNDLTYRPSDRTLLSPDDDNLYPDFGHSYSCLGWALACDNAPAVALLLQKRASVTTNACEWSGWALGQPISNFTLTPLGMALSSGHLPAMVMLLEHGASPSQPYRQGFHGITTPEEVDSSVHRNSAQRSLLQEAAALVKQRRACRKAALSLIVLFSALPRPVFASPGCFAAMPRDMVMMVARRVWETRFDPAWAQALAPGAVAPHMCMLQ